MNTVCLVDLENIGVAPLCEYVEQYPDNEYIIFYSDNTSNTGSVLEGLPDMTRVSFIDCKTGGNNAMDFCICAMAGKLSVGRMLKLNILSNDKGYDPMIRMLQEQGTRIIRKRTDYEQNKRNEDKSHIPADAAQPAIQIHQYGIESVIKNNVPKKYQHDMMKSVTNVINRKEAHEMCQAILPKNIATDVYRRLRKYIPREVV